MKKIKRIVVLLRKFMRIFCFIRFHYWKTQEYVITDFVVKEYCKCRNCGKEKVFISENDMTT